ncbi:MAG: DUF302 domain-containing protein [Ardenticatenaceae bacterium]|nr:DUF302 domain-containing protein [Ardenticatenaceae bacterium]
MSEKLGFEVYLNDSYEAALERVTEELKKEGFGVLTEIDVKATLKKKLDVDFCNYKILGACNPPLAYKALTAAPEAGLLLPCNVTVSEEVNGRVLVSIVDPNQMLNFLNNPKLEGVATDAAARLRRVAAALEA